MFPRTRFLTLRHISRALEHWPLGSKYEMFLQIETGAANYVRGEWDGEAPGNKKNVLCIMLQSMSKTYNIAPSNVFQLKRQNGCFCR